MEPNKILSANILDLIFDDRNKEYGAYELRVTYPERIKKSLLLVFVIAGIAITGAALANSFKPDKDAKITYREMTLEEIKQDEKEPEKLPEPKQPEPEPQAQTEKLINLKVVEDDQADPPLATQDDLEDAQISNIKQAGVVDDGIVDIEKDLGKGKGIIETRVDDAPAGPVYIVEIDAKFTGNWEKFLTRNLNANIPVENGAPTGRYTVIIQFVVDLEGNVSDIKPLTNHGYGMEEEAVRVLKKAAKWEPAIQNGHQVKAYRKQPITFLIEEQ